MVGIAKARISCDEEELVIELTCSHDARAEVTADVLTVAAHLLREAETHLEVGLDIGTVMTAASTVITLRVDFAERPALTDPSGFLAHENATLALFGIAIDAYGRHV